jgi:uncharacterized protein (DUF111 family)
VILLEANIDDMTGEELGFLMERLFEEGALDVTFTPCVMKKSRPGTIVAVLGRPETRTALGECLLRHSSSIGFREREMNRYFLDRKSETVKFPVNGKEASAGGNRALGEVREKTVFLDPPRSKIEFEDRARIARERGVSLREAEELIRKERDR